MAQIGNKKCEECRGKGELHGTTCESCDGEGWQLLAKDDCPVCNNTGAMEYFTDGFQVCIAPGCEAGKNFAAEVEELENLTNLQLEEQLQATIRLRGMTAYDADRPYLDQVGLDPSHFIL
jgi:hypothetical protein